VISFARRVPAALAVLAVSGLAGAGTLGAQQEVRVEDDLGRTVRLEVPPARIVSLVPAVTEVLFALGAGDRLVGRSVWDDEPPAVLSVPSVGDALRPDPERVLARRPDLVILHAGPDNAGAAERLAGLGAPTLAVRIDDLDDLDRTLRLLGRLLSCEGEAGELRERIRSELEEVRAATADLPRVSVYYDVAWPPAITIGGGSYLDDLITIAGGRNVFGDLTAPSPHVALEAIVARDPDVILVPGDDAIAASAGPRDRPGWDAVGAVMRGDLRRVDASLLHRLGPRVGAAARALAAALHPGLAPETHP
jgi:ABC-type Fe3+-hydroxamate transport system substrate-binding protein